MEPVGGSGVSGEPVLVGREAERERLARFVGGVRNGHGDSLLFVGEPGIGKSALLGAYVRDLPGVQVVKIDGYESESTMPYAGLERLLRPLGSLTRRLPERHAQVLSAALGAPDAVPSDRYLVGLALLEVLALAGTELPVVCVVDDVHLLDPETVEALAFVARRLVVEPVGLLLAGQDVDGVTGRLAGVPVETLGGLATEAGVRLLNASVADPVDPATATQIASATGGNPLALIDLAATFSAADLTDLSLGTDPVPIGRRLERHYVSTVQATEAPVQEWMLIAAADSTGSVELTSAAASAAGLATDVLDRAEGAGLVEIRDRIRFRHPLVRSAVYNSADGATRRRVHRRLADAAAALGRPELEAWHAARATLGTDPDVAQRLVEVADLAARRGGFASRASNLVRAAQLTPPGRLRQERQVAAAEAALRAGAGGLAGQVLQDVGADDAEPVVRGRVLLVESALAMFSADPAVVSAPAALITAADLFRDRAPDLERQALLTAFDFCLVAERLVQGIDLPDLGRRLQQCADGDGVDAADAAVLRGLGALIGLPYADAAPLARAGLDAVLAGPDHELMQRFTTIAALSTFLWDEAVRADALTRVEAAARDAGALQLVDATLWVRSLVELSSGTVTNSVRSIDQVREVRRVMGYDAENVINAATMAWTGVPKQVVLAVAEGTNATGFGGVGAAAVGAVGLRELAEGDYRAAYERLKPFVEQPFLHVTALQYPDYAEAAARTGRVAEAATYAQRLAGLAAVNGSSWCRGVAERAAGLVADDEVAEKHFRESVEALRAVRAPIDLARTHLVYGEWLRRRRRRADAGDQLLEAVRLFERSGADMFVGRARAELDAAGLRADGPVREPGVELTTQERSVAEQAAAGRTNAEIASNLFISPNTVDYHLRKVFQKLGISSRRQLRDRFDPEG